MNRNKLLKMILVQMLVLLLILELQIVEEKIELMVMMLLLTLVQSEFVLNECANQIKLYKDNIIKKRDKNGPFQGCG